MLVKVVAKCKVDKRRGKKLYTIVKIGAKRKVG